ncbi:hypothetical protein N9W89_05700 [Hellea sp.]|nr:hypothetical protein [Hellea sp.]
MKQMKYDDASWHSDGEFPEDSPAEYGGTHIALFMKWCFLKGWASDEHLLDAEDDLKDVISNKMTATEFFFKYCDGKLTHEDFNEEGNDFAEAYYTESEFYLADYAEEFYEQMYIASEQEHDFTKFSKMVENRYEDYSKLGSFSGDALGDMARTKSDQTPWWKFWN